MKLVRTLKNPNTYIKNLCCLPGYAGAITVEHRCNNPKRDYLFVNRFQCKHIPASPTRMEKMCKDLASLVESRIGDYKVLVIGFAETATAIAKFVADNLTQCNYVMSTTREDIEGSKELITFEEEHSHATTQKLLTYDYIDKSFMKNFDYILFVEDEISTGNTILNFIKAFNKEFDSKLRFGVASICNWQSEENRKLFIEKNIDRFYLIGGELIDANAKMELDETCISVVTDIAVKPDSRGIVNYSDKNSFKVERLGYTKGLYSYNFDDIVDKYKNYGSVRIIASEECMYPAIKLGTILENYGVNVICHASTRSKIDTMSYSPDGPAYGICSGGRVVSAYDSERKTYIYNTEEITDAVIVISDTPNKENFEKFVQSISRICKDVDEIEGFIV